MPLQILTVRHLTRYRVRAIETNGSCRTFDRPEESSISRPGQSSLSLSENPHSGRESVFVVEADSVEELGVSPSVARDSTVSSSFSSIFTHTHVTRARFLSLGGENPSVLVAS